MSPNYSQAVQVLAELQSVEAELLAALTDGDLEEVPALSARQKELTERLHELLASISSAD